MLTEIKLMLKLAGPIVFMQLGMVMFGVVDTMYMGRLGAEAIAASGLGHTVIFCFFIFGLGLLLGIDTLVSQAYGAGDKKRCVHVIFHAFVLALCAIVPLIFITHIFARSVLEAFEVKESIIESALIYIGIVKWFYFPALLFVVCRQFLQSLNKLRPLMIAIVLANLLHIVGNELLVFGKYGFPALGIKGCAISTIVSNILLLCIAASAVWQQIKRIDWSGFQFQKSIFDRLVRLGIPSGVQMFFEVGIFTVTTIIMGKIGTIALASHQVILSIASVSFMVPLGLSYAVAVRVGYGVGQKSAAASRLSANTGMLFAISFALFTCFCFFVFPEFLIHLYTKEQAVVELAMKLLMIAGFFQLFDGLQVVMTGIFRGAGNTKISMYVNLASHWFIAFPLGIYLAFYNNWGATGLWTALLVGLGFVAVALFSLWQVRYRDLLLAN